MKKIIFILIAFFALINLQAQNQKPRINKNGSIQRNTPLPTTPIESWLKYDFSANAYIYYDGTNWRSIGAGSFSLDDVTTVGNETLNDLLIGDRLSLFNQSTSTRIWTLESLNQTLFINNTDRTIGNSSFAFGVDGTLDLINSSGFSARLSPNLLTSSRTYNFPDKDGTFAMLDDITGGGSIALPQNQIGYGSGTGIISVPDFTYNAITKTLNLNGDGTANDSAFLTVNGSNAFEFRDGDGSIRTSNNIHSGAFVLNGGTSDDILLGDGMTTSLSALQTGGNISIPLNQAVYGTGTGVTSSSDFIFDDTDNSLSFGGLGKIKFYTSHTALEALSGNNLRLTTFGSGNHVGINTGNSPVSSLYLGGNFTDQNGTIRIRGGNAANSIDSTEESVFLMKAGGLDLDVLKGSFSLNTFASILFNLDGNDSDFRVDGVGVAGDNLIRTNALTARVGIGTSPTAEKLEVNGYTLSTGFKIPLGTDDDLLLADGTTTSLSGISGSGISHAPSDGNIYGSQNGNWVTVPSGSAPSDSVSKADENSLTELLVNESTAVLIPMYDSNYVSTTVLENGLDTGLTFVAGTGDEGTPDGSSVEFTGSTRYVSSQPVIIPRYNATLTVAMESIGSADQMIISHNVGGVVDGLNTSYVLFRSANILLGHQGSSGGNFSYPSGFDKTQPFVLQIVFSEETNVTNVYLNGELCGINSAPNRGSSFIFNQIGRSNVLNDNLNGKMRVLKLDYKALSFNQMNIEQLALLDLMNATANYNPIKTGQDLWRNLVVISGQSNADGRGVLVDSDWDRFSFNGIQTIQNTQDVTFSTYGFSNNTNPNYDYGFHYSLFNRLAKWNKFKNIQVFKYAVGGSSFSSNNWNKGDTYYKTLRLAVRSIVDINKRQGYKTNIIFVWNQGESDGDNSTEANNYQLALTTFASDISIDFGGNEFKFIIHRLPTNGSTPETSTIQTAQLNVSNLSANYYLQDNDGLVLFDNIHFDKSSLDTIGKRTFEIIETNNLMK